MRKRLFFLTLLCVVLTGISSGQKVVNGLLIQENNEPVPFATIGIMALGYGTISNLDGSFELKLTETHESYELTISALGYEPQRLAIKNLVDEERLIITLKETATFLDEVLIVDDNIPRKKPKRIGNRQFNTGTMRMDTSRNGGAMALLIRKQEKPYSVQKVRLWIAHNSLPEFKVRTRILIPDSLGFPGDDLFDKSIVQVSDFKRGWLFFDLSELQLEIDSDVFLVFEWVMDKADRMELARQVASYLSNAPDEIEANTITIEGSKVKEKTIKGFKSGVWFGTMLFPGFHHKFDCYYRLSAFSGWQRSGAILTGEIQYYSE